MAFEGVERILNEVIGAGLLILALLAAVGEVIYAIWEIRKDE